MTCSMICLIYSFKPNKGTRGFEHEHMSNWNIHKRVIQNNDYVQFKCTIYTRCLTDRQQIEHRLSN